MCIRDRVESLKDQLGGNTSGEGTNGENTENTQNTENNGTTSNNNSGSVQANTNTGSKTYTVQAVSYTHLLTTKHMQTMILFTILLLHLLFMWQVSYLSG